MGDDFGVGFGDELVSLGGQLPLEIEVVFNDAIVHNDDAAGAVAMGMGVFFSGAAVGSPARVADAERAGERMLAQDFFEILKLAGSAADFKYGAAGAADCDACGIVAAIFQAPEALKNDRDYLLFADVPDDSAHGMILCERVMSERNVRLP